MHSQTILEAVLRLRDSISAIDDIETVSAGVFRTAHDIDGGGAYGPKHGPQTKVEADREPTDQVGFQHECHVDE